LIAVAPAPANAQAGPAEKDTEFAGRSRYDLASADVRHGRRWQSLVSAGWIVIDIIYGRATAAT